jgi:hypothetical protein
MTEQRIYALSIQEVIADDLYKTANSPEERRYYAKELADIRSEMSKLLEHVA